MSREIDPHVLEMAAHHFIAVEDAPSSETLEARDRWLAEDPMHLEAYGMIADSAQDFEPAECPSDLRAMGADVRAKYAGTHENAAGRRKWAAVAAVAAVAVLAIGIGARHFVAAPAPVVYQTAMGEQRNVVLSDGSHVALDSGTRLIVRFGQHRDVDLAYGQARFMVAHDPDHPFIVQAGQRMVRAIGTDYVVDHYDGRVTISLLTGRVWVSTRRPPEPWHRVVPFLAPEALHIDLSPGQQLRGDDGEGRLALAQSVSTKSMMLWQERKIRLDNDSLEVAVAKINRYATHPVTITGDAIGKLRLSGMFPAGDVPAFVEAVTRILPVESRRLPDGTVVLEAL